MIEEMSGGRLKWDMWAAGTVVGTFEVLDAVNRGPHRRDPRVAGLLGRQELGGRPLRAGPGGPFGMDREEYLGWLFSGGGLELYNELLQKELKMNVVVPVFTTSLPYWEPLGWFKKPFANLDDLRKMRFRTSGLGMEMMKTHGHLGGDARGRRGHSRARARRRRGRGVGDPEPRHRDGLPERREELLHARPAPARLLPGGRHQQEEVGRAAEGSPGHREVGGDGRDHPHDRVQRRPGQQGGRGSREEARREDPEDAGRRPQGAGRSHRQGLRGRGAKNPFFAKVLKSQRDFASRAVPHAQKIRPPIEVVVAHYWKK